MVDTLSNSTNATPSKDKNKKKRKSTEMSPNGIATIKTEPVDKYDELLRFLSPISKPLASKKLTKKLYKLLRKSSKEKGTVRRGVREVMKFIRKGETGLVVLAGDVSPIDVITHVPVVCEERRIPYCFTPAKQELGEALGSKRPSCMALIKSPADGDLKELFDDCHGRIKELPLPL